MMKKMFLASFVIFPMISMADVPACLFSYNNTYTFTKDGHSGTLTRTQNIQANNAYNISTLISVTAFFSTHVVNQQAQGTFNNFSIIPASYATDQGGNGMQTTALSNNTIDTVSLPLALACAIKQGSNAPMLSSPVSILYQGNVVSMNCSVVNVNASVTINSTTIPATQIGCTTQDQSTVLSYAFSNDGSYTLLSMSDTENGSVASSAILVENPNNS